MTRPVAESHYKLTRQRLLAEWLKPLQTGQRLLAEWLKTTTNSSTIARRVATKATTTLPFNHL
jgi:hypothetical protein